MRLDRDPLPRRPPPPQIDLCATDEKDCVAWEPDTIWIEPGMAEKAYLLLSLPAFIAVDVVLWTLRRSGVDQLYVFMISTPIFVGAWYWFAGWMIDKRHRKLSAGQTQDQA